MRDIAATLEEGDNCFKNHLLDSLKILEYQANIIDLKINEASLKTADDISQKEIKLYEKKSKKLSRRLKWTKLGWATTTIILTGFCIYLGLK